MGASRRSDAAAGRRQTGNPEGKDGLRRIEELRRRFAGGITAEEAFAEARRELEERLPGGAGLEECHRIRDKISHKT
ncbi:MAG: hypothetical protein ACUVTQ_11415 [Desulfotomaculales bacterium]